MSTSLPTTGPVSRERRLADAPGRPPSRGGARDRLARLTAKMTRAAIRATRSGMGSTLPGRLAEHISPGVLGRATRGLDPIVLVSATNGKTTTTALVSAALRAGGHRVLSNSTGSNLHRGLTTAALCSRGDADCAVFEVDEATLPAVVDELGPSMLVLLNLSRDQLDRYYEVHSLAGRWRAAAGRLPPGARVVTVDHDPLVCHAAETAPETITVGVAGAPLGRDSAGCPRCGELLEVSSSGQPRCPACRWRPPPRQVEAERLGSAVRLRGFGAEVQASLPVSSPGYTANATAAWAAAVCLGVPPLVAMRAIAAVEVVESRYAEVAWHGRKVRLLLAKNPAGWDDVLSAVAASRRPATVSINAGIPDGRDTSWIWDVDMGALRGRPMVVASGERADDLALRLTVAGIDPVVEPQLDRALLRTVDEGGAMDLLADYTSFQAARRLVGNG
jgi:lipid II isoglutaminyl synthase (glutamine-hydrolysing)